MSADKKITRFSSGPWHLVAVIATTLFAITVINYSFDYGWFSVFPNLLYFPIIIACVYYLKRGFVFSVLLSLFYLILVIGEAKDVILIYRAIIRVIIFILVAGVVTIISLHRKRAEELLIQERLFSDALIDSLPSVCYALDENGVFLRWNKNMERVSNYEREEITHINILAIIAEQDKELIRSKMTEVVVEGSASTEANLLTRNGLSIPYHFNWIRANIGGKTYLLGMGMDITNRKQAEEIINGLNANLERHVAALTEANKELESFSYSVSHDLRAPLRHIMGFSELLQQTAVNLDEKGQRYLRNILESVKRMGNLIDDLLSFSRMGRTEMHKGTIITGQLVEDIIKELSDETKGRNIIWNIEELPPIYGDYAMLRLAFTNLIANALKFTRKREQARIEIGCILSEDNETVLFIRDNGAGFDMKYVDSLFGVFQRLHSRNEFEGTGIGLANVRRIVLRHGGRVWAEGTVNSGATFYVSVPN